MNWRERYASLIALSAIGEGCKKQLDDKLESMITSILPYLADQVSTYCFDIFSTHLLLFSLVFKYSMVILLYYVNSLMLHVLYKCNIPVQCTI